MPLIRTFGSLNKGTRIQLRISGKKTDALPTKKDVKQKLDVTVRIEHCLKLILTMH